MDKGVQTFCVSDASVFVSTWNKGGEVFLSTNYGANWIPANEGLPTEYDCVINNLAICKGSVFAGSASRGVWQRQLSEMVTSNKRAPELAEHFSLHQNYPNPFNPSTTIKYDLPKTSRVRLAVYDVLGREVVVLVNEKKDARVHEVKFDGSNSASGVYFYRIQAGDFVATRRLLLLK